MPVYINDKRHYNKRNNPRKGTKRRALVLRLLRKDGLTPTEAKEELGLSHDNFRHMNERLLDDYGYDIRVFQVGPKRTDLKYRLVGQNLNGTYRDFLRGVKV